METALLLLAGANWGVTRSTVRVSKHKGVSIVNRGCRPSSITPFIHNKPSSFATSEEANDCKLASARTNARGHPVRFDHQGSDEGRRCRSTPPFSDAERAGTKVGRSFTPEFDVLADIAYRLNKQGADQPTTPGVRSMVAEAALAM